jgi:hypothetical protein
MPMFVQAARVPVTLDGDNTIYIREKMDFGTKQKVMAAFMRVGAGKGGNGDAEIDIAGYEYALMVHNIVGWTGPEFAAFACNETNIARLDPDEPLVQAALTEIAKRNPLQSQTKEQKGGPTSGGALGVKADG